MADRKPTARDVAERAGVSRSMVSMYLSRNPNLWISEETKARLEAAIRELVANPALAAELGANGRKLVESRFGWKTMSDTLLKDYAECLAAKKN